MPDVPQQIQNLYYYPILQAMKGSSGHFILVAICDSCTTEAGPLNVWEYQDGKCSKGLNGYPRDVTGFVAECLERWAVQGDAPGVTQ